jgi:START domain
MSSDNNAAAAAAAATVAASAESDSKTNAAETKQEYSDIPEEYLKALEQAREFAISAVEAREEDGWIWHANEHDIEIHTRTDPTNASLLCTRGVGIIESPLERVVGLFSAISLRSEWDGMFLDGTIVDKLAPDTRVLHLKFKGIWPVAPRDMVICGQRELINNDCVMMYSTSVDHNDVQDDSKCVRGKLKYGVTHMTRLNENSTRVVMSNASDPMGMLPKFVVKAASKKAPLAIHGIRTVLDERGDEVWAQIQELGFKMPPPKAASD